MQRDDIMNQDEMRSGQLSSGTKWILAVILLAYVSVLVVGLCARQVMIGDEVTHYYMLVTQAGKLPYPNFDAEIPMADGTVEERQYPHVFLWHYFGALLFRLSNSFAVVQIYHSLFWLQLLIVGWLLARNESGGKDDSGVLLYVACLASLPMGLLFSVAFYQDVPATAQIMTSFLFLRKRRLALSLLFICLAFLIKETVFVFFPIYLVCVAMFFRRSQPVIKTAIHTFLALIVFILLFWGTAELFDRCGWDFYPKYTMRSYVLKAWERCTELTRRHDSDISNTPANPNQTVVKEERRVTPRPEIANHPGDLRFPINYFLFGGGILWVVVAMGAAGMLSRRWIVRCGEGSPGYWVSRQWIVCRREEGYPSYWALLVGVSYIAITAYHMRTAPDARFFLSGLPFVLLPLTQAASALPGRRIWLPLILVASMIQGVPVMAKTWTMRHVPDGVFAAIEYLKAKPPQPNSVFMYPEGNYRLFPCQHNWYLDYALNDFWKADNDQRIRMLHEFKLGAIVIKKYRIGKLDAGMNNLGIYPDSFVHDVENDTRFVKVLDNNDVVIYLVPPADTQ